jgi:calcineurin-like phosphoesterase family protein
MSKTWVTADWHLGEDRMDLMGRPFVTKEQHIETLIANHNALVNPEDTVCMLGDVCYQKAPECLPLVSRFHGRKILVRGNHDRIFTNDDLKPYFEEIYEEGKGFFQVVKNIPCYFTHYPTQGTAMHFNLVGHIHSAWKFQLNMLNVGVDVSHFRPIDLDKIDFYLKAITEFYDEDVWVGYNAINDCHRATRGKKSTYFTPSK